MAEAMHLVVRFLHVGAAMLWIGYLAFLARGVIPAARDGSHGANVGPIVNRMRAFSWLGPLVLVLGFWLVTASGHGMADLLEPGWGHAILGGIGLAVGMMGLEHAVVVPRLREAHGGPAHDRRENLDRAALAASVAALLGLVAAFLMIFATFGAL